MAPEGTPDRVVDIDQTGTPDRVVDVDDPTSYVSSFNGRSGGVSPQQSDYDSFFLTQTEGDARYGQLGASAPFTQGSVLFADATGRLEEDDANLFWDDTNNWVQIGPRASFQYVPNQTMVVYGTAKNPLTLVRQTAGNAGAGTPLKMLQEATSALTDGFGPRFRAAVVDSAGTALDVGALDWARSGADNTFTSRWCTTIAGVDAPRISIGATGVASIPGGLATNTISELTAAAGVTIDGVLLKDGGATLASLLPTTDNAVDFGSGAAQFRTLFISDALRVDNVQVVGAQGAAVADATDAGSVIARLNDLLARLRTHGLIAT